jgi:5-dehydro-4-deoxyglucarate dehydratase
MQPNELRNQLNGVIVFPVTPFKADDSLNLEGLRANLRALLRHPVCAVVAAAGTGELYSLSAAEHRAVVQATVEEVKGRVPVIAATGFNPPIASELARGAAAVGAQGILAFPPYYPSPDDEGIVAYYRGIGETTNLGVTGSIRLRRWWNSWLRFRP